MEFSESFLKINDAVEYIEQLTIYDCTELVALPPKIVDNLTDEENLNFSVDENIVNNLELPEISGNLEVFIDNSNLCCKNSDVFKKAKWQNFASNENILVNLEVKKLDDFVDLSIFNALYF